MKTNYHHFSTLFFLIAALLFTSCTKREPIQLTFAFGTEDSGTLAAIIKDFNDAHQGDIQVNWRVMLMKWLIPGFHPLR